MLATSPADAIRARRIEEGLSRRALAERAGISASTIQLVEEGWSGGRGQARKRIALALGLTLEDVL